MCRQDSRVRLSAEEEMEAEESLSIYCKPVELYNILQRRAIRNPSFLQRCLRYKIQAKHKRRIQMTISLSATVNEVLKSQNLSPICIFLARLVSNVEYLAIYRFSRGCVLDSSAGVEGSTQIQAHFILPEINKLAPEAKSGSLAILLVSWVGVEIPLGTNLSKGSLDPNLLPSTSGGYCFWGKIPLESLYMSWESSPNFSLGQRAEIMTTVNMNSCFSKLSCLNEDKCISVQLPCNPETVTTLQQVQVTISAEEMGAKEKSPYNSYICGDIPSSSLSHIIRLRAGNVIFNYRYYNNKLQRTEVTEDFSCPFCLVKCASFKGLRYHLSSSHDLFNFEFWVTEEYQAVNVSVKTDTWRSEAVADGVDPKQQTFSFCSKPLRRRRPKNLVQNAKHVHPLVLESELPSGVCELQDKADGMRSFLVSISTNCALLRKRQFFHSHRAQPMALEQVLSDRDSEDEVDDDVADFEDRRMLDDFVDVTKDEKLMMHMWNSFVRKQRVLADGHIPWACEAFSRLHGPDLVHNSALIKCWRLFMIKLWNHGLLDARTMNNCNVFLEQCQSQDLCPKS
ncbi:polycomb group protein EMBRYONIC FLOWER 2 [Quercus suber]|uniref:polycomb group protein EMBRYONIC FLOWER 2 n=1 Tax=Quercus suber TaxID=58331 RepID=UPI0032DF23FB